MSVYPTWSTTLSAAVFAVLAANARGACSKAGCGQHPVVFFTGRTRVALSRA